MDRMDDFDRLFEQTRRALESMRTTGSPGDGVEVEPVRGVGSAAGGQIEVLMVGQRVESVRVDPRALRMGSELLSEEIAHAVNAALDDLREQAAQPGATIPAVDPAELAQRLGDLQTESARSMSVMTDALADAVRQIERGAR